MVGFKSLKRVWPLTSSDRKRLTPGSQRSIVSLLKWKYLSSRVCSCVCALKIQLTQSLLVSSLLLGGGRLRSVSGLCATCVWGCTWEECVLRLCANILVIHHYACQCVCLTCAHLSPQPLGIGASSYEGVKYAGVRVCMCLFTQDAAPWGCRGGYSVSVVMDRCSVWIVMWKWKTCSWNLLSVVLNKVGGR